MQDNKEILQRLIKDTLKKAQKARNRRLHKKVQRQVLPIEKIQQIIASALEKAMKIYGQELVRQKWTGGISEGSIDLGLGEGRQRGQLKLILVKLESKDIDAFSFLEWVIVNWFVALPLFWHKTWRLPPPYLSWGSILSNLDRLSALYAYLSNGQEGELTEREMFIAEEINWINE